MKIAFAPSFWKSLKKISRHQTWWYKTYEFFWYNIPWFIKNIYQFRKELWQYRTWDGAYPLSIFKRALELNKDVTVNGNEITEIRFRKVAMMRRAIELLDNYCNNRYIDLAEQELNKEVNSDYAFRPDEPEDIKKENREIFDRARQLEEEQWNELWEIIKGREPVIPDDKKEEYDAAYNAQDGSGIKTWWT